MPLDKASKSGSGERVYFLLTLGCPKNEVDSDLIESRLAEAGWRKAENPRAASAIIVNTCAFIAPALEESIEEVLDLADLKKETGAKLALAGCMVARYGEQKLGELLPEVDCFIPFEAYDKVAEWLSTCARVSERVEGKAGLSDFRTSRGCTHALIKYHSMEWCRKRTFSSTLHRGFVYVKIAEGCSRRCAFCVIPLIRGPLRSRYIEDIRDEVRFFLERGAHEIVLVAQDTTQYGKDIYGRPCLPALIEKLAGLEGEFRLRVMYMHPEGLSDDIMRAMQDAKVCPYLDLPFQHADARVLKSMGRKGDSRSYLELLDRARQCLGEVAVRATLMVGFPGEDRGAYVRLRGFVQEARFDWLALFVYSHEEGTPAFSLQNTVRKGTARSRFDELSKLQEEIMREKASELVGREFRVLLEGKSAEAPGFWEARSWREAPEVDGIIFVRDAPGLRPGSCRDVNIVSTEGIDLHGVVKG